MDTLREKIKNILSKYDTYNLVEGDEEIELLGDWFYSLTNRETFWELTLHSPSYIWLTNDKRQPYMQDIRGKSIAVVFKKALEILESFKEAAKKEREFVENPSYIEA